MVLKDLELAESDNHEILAEVLGYANTNDASGPTKPDMSGKGLAAAMIAAIPSDVNVDDIRHINSHGSGTFYNDLVETRAITSVFGPGIRTSTIKPVIGHTHGACGAYELLASALSLLNQVMIPTKTSEAGDDELNLNYCINKSVPGSFDYVLKNSLGFWGGNSSILLKRWSN